MTYQQVADMIAGIGLPYAYYEFPDGTEIAPPFLCFLFPGSNDLAADDSNYQKVRPCRLELYTVIKDFALEARVEGALNAAGLFYTREEGFLDGERMNMVAYDFTVFITE